MVDKSLPSEQWYHGLLPREDIRMMLRKTGDFIVRSTEPVKGQPRQYVLSVMFKESAEDGIKHFVLREYSGKIFIEKQGFDTVSALVEHHYVSKEPISQTAILQTPIFRQNWEVAHSEVYLTKKLGEGAFGEVWKGKLTLKNSTVVDVAVKAAKLETMNKEQIKEIMREARLMRFLEHTNVVKFYGVAAGQEPLYVIMELADCGALDSFLQKNSLPLSKRTEMIYQAACGIAYIHEKNLLHRDIAARNCLYGGGQVKISDFGLTREGTVYQMDLHKKVPIRWLAPETLRTGLYTQKTDVFAYGVMAWEIFENGKEPYPGMMVAEVVAQVNKGYRMPFNPDVAPELAAFISKRCWSESPNDRYVMKDIVNYLQKAYKFKASNPTATTVNTVVEPAMSSASNSNSSQARNNTTSKKTLWFFKRKPRKVNSQSYFDKGPNSK